MSDSYLTAHTGICVGGMFFKTGDKVRIYGRLLTTGSIVDKVGIIHDIGLYQHYITMKFEGGLFVFNLDRIYRLEHVKEEAK